MQPGLTRDSLLERAPAITLKLQAGSTLALVDGKTLPVGVHALEVLALCTEPTRVSDLAARARVEGARDFIDFMATVSDLVGNGLLRVPGSKAGPIDRRGEWADPAIHVAMLNDLTRSVAFVEAVRAAVRPGDVVLDIGTGTGVLALAAAKAGARHVYAIEASEMAEVATAMVEKNGLSDRVTVLRGFSTRLKLAERASVLVTETIGNDPLSEYAVELLVDAHKRLLTPDARVIPAVLRVHAAPVEAPHALLDRLSYTPRNIDRWSAALGIDFSALREVASAPFPASIIADRARDIVELGPPVELGRLDYSKPAPVGERSARLEITRAGRLAGVLLTFDVDVGAGRTLSTRPTEAALDSHWLPTLYIDPSSRDVGPGDAVDVAFRQDGSSALLEIAR